MNVFRILLWPLRGRDPHSAADIPLAARLTPDELEKINPILRVHDGATEVAYCTPNRYAKWRVDTLFAKEPDTIERRRAAVRRCAMCA